MNLPASKQPKLNVKQVPWQQRRYHIKLPHEKTPFLDNFVQGLLTQFPLLTVTFKNDKK